MSTGLRKVNALFRAAGLAERTSGEVPVIGNFAERHESKKRQKLRFLAIF